MYRDISPRGWALVLGAAGPLRAAGLPWSSTPSTSTSASRCSLVAAAFLCGARSRPRRCRRSANGGWGLTVARLGGPEFAARWTAALTAPFVEETLKGCGVVMIYLIARDEIDDVMDGFVYGAVCGLGFAIVEDVFYFMSVFGGSRPGCSRGSSCAWWRAGCTPTSSTPGWWGWRWGSWCRAARPNPLGRRLLRSPPGSAPWRCSATSCGTPRARPVPGRALDRGRLADGAGRHRGEGAPAPRVRGDRGRARPPSRTALAPRRPRGEVGLDGISAEELAGARLAQAPPRRPAGDAASRGVARRPRCSTDSSGSR